MSSYSRPSIDYRDYFLWYYPSIYSDDSGNPHQIVCSTESHTPTPFSIYERIKSSLGRDLALLSVLNDMAPPTRSTSPTRLPPLPNSMLEKYNLEVCYVVATLNQYSEHVI